MNLLQIRTDFVGKTGRHDLVVDLTDYTDNGANFFIQAGQRLLDSILPYRKDIGRFVTTVNSNQSSVFLKYVRAYDSVYLTASGISREPLDRKSYSWLIEQYGDDYGEKAGGLISFTAVPGEDATLIIGSETYTFKASPTLATHVQIGSTILETIENLVSKLNTQSSIVTASKYSATQVLVQYYLVGTAGNSVSWAVSDAGMTLDDTTLGAAIAGRANQITSGRPIYWAPVISTPHPELTLSGLATLDSHDLLFGLERFSKDGILFMPPADQSYVLTIFGYFFSKMEADADISYHSENYPELLVMASALVLEAFYRNTQGVQDWLSSINLFLKGIDHDLVREEMVLSGNQLRG